MFEECNLLKGVTYRKCQHVNMCRWHLKDYQRALVCLKWISPTKLLFLRTTRRSSLAHLLPHVLCKLQVRYISFLYIYLSLPISFSTSTFCVY